MRAHLKAVITNPPGRRNEEFEPSLRLKAEAHGSSGGRDLGRAERSMIVIMQSRLPRDVAITCGKVTANAVTTTRRMGEVGAPCFWGCVDVADSRSHYLQCGVLQRTAAGAFPRRVARCPAAASPTQVSLVGLEGGPEACVYAAAWHEAWVQTAASGRRAWRDGRPLPRGDAGLVARLRATSRKVGAVAAAVAWADGAPAHRRHAGWRQA